jgi:hypothetical protein
MTTVNAQLAHNYRALRAMFPRNTATETLARARQRTAEGKHIYRDAPSVGKPFGGSLRFISDWSAFFRRMEYADVVAPRCVKHQGWYCDAYQDAIYRGAIFQLPGKDGNSRWLAGYIDSNNDSAAVIDFSKVFSAHGEGDHGDLRDAASRADDIADGQAEDAREYDRAWQAGRMWREAMDELPQLRTSTRELIAACRTTTGDVAKRCVMDAVRANLSERSRLLADAEKYVSGEDSKFYFYANGEKSRIAFNDGAQEKVLF